MPCLRLHRHHLAPLSVSPTSSTSGRRAPPRKLAIQIMAESGAHKEAAPVRSPATSPPQHFPGVPASSYASGSAQQLFYPSAPTCSFANPSTLPHLYPPLMETSSANPTWLFIHRGDLNNIMLACICGVT